jgi:NodT family efflux transporter outer membrane factor (OMF) lipoprotein
MKRASLLLVALLTGCSLSKPPTRDAVLQDALPPTTTIPSTWSSAAAADSVAGDWLKTFNDPALEAIVAEAIANNLDLRQAAARVEVARQRIGLATSQLLPHVGGKLDASVTRDVGESNNYDANTVYGEVSWEIDIWGKLRAKRAGAKAGYQASALEFAWARQSLAAMTARSWYFAIETRQLVELARRAVQMYADLSELTRFKRAAGQVSELDVAEASAKLNEAQSQLRQAQGIDAEARRSLQLLLGRYPSAEIDVSADFVPVPPPVGAGVPSALVGRRPDILAAEQQVLRTFRMREAAKRSLLPAISVGFGGGRLSDVALTLLGLNPYVMRGVVGASVPIYEGGALTTKVRIATAEQQQAVAHYGAVTLNAFREVEAGLTAEQLLAQQTDYTAAALRDRTEAVRVATQQYQAGATDMLTVLQLQTAQLASEAGVIQLRNAQLANRVTLHLALGGSYANSDSTIGQASAPDAQAK